jgi:hypothetical protein
MGACAGPSGDDQYFDAAHTGDHGKDASSGNDDGSPSSSGGDDGGDDGSPSSSGGPDGSPSSSGGPDASPSGGKDGGKDSGSVTKPDSGPGGSIFASCSLTGGCIADCSPPANDPLASPDPSQYDIYDGCIIAGLKIAGFTDPWVGQLLKGEALEEGGTIVSSVTTDLQNSPCGGQNCGMISISGGSVSGDSPPGPCGVTAKDPFTNTTDYSHSYGLFQDTPACEGTFLMPNLPSGYSCTGTTTNDLVPFSSSQKAFYCETATSQGVQDLSGNTVKGYINAITEPNDPYYKLSIFNPAYNLFVHLTHSLPIEYQQANQGLNCTNYQQMYNTLAYWLVGNPITSCKLSGQGLKYVQDTIGYYKQIYGKAWPYPAP